MFINESDSAIDFLDDGSLLIRSVGISADGSVGEEGMYQCEVSNAFGSDLAITEVKAGGGKGYNATCSTTLSITS